MIVTLNLVCGTIFPVEKIEFCGTKVQHTLGAI